MSPPLILDLASSYFFHFVHILINLWLFPHILHLFGKPWLGLFTLLFNLGNFLGLALGWMGAPMVRYIGEALAIGDRDRMIHFYSAGKNIFCIYGILAGILCWMLSPIAENWIENPLLRADPGAITGAIRWLALFLAANFFWQIDLIHLTAIKRVRIANLFRLLYALLWGGLLYLDSSTNFQRLLFAPAIATLVSAIATFLYLQFCVPHFRWTLSVPPTIFKTLFSELGGLYFLHGMLFILFLQLDPYFFGLFGGVATAALFSIHWKVPETLTNLQWRFSDTLHPYITSAFFDPANPRRHGLADHYHHVKRRMTAVALALLVSYLACGPMVLRWWLGHDHAPRPFLGYLIPGVAMFFLSLSKIDQVIALAVGGVGPILIFQSVEILAKIFGIIVMRPQFGALASLLCYNLVSAPLFFAYYRHTLGLLRPREAPP